MGILEIMVIITGIAVGLEVLVLVANGVHALAHYLSYRHYDKHRNFDTVWHRVEWFLEPIAFL